jgi:hypothetical protein
MKSAACTLNTEASGFIKEAEASKIKAQPRFSDEKIPLR